MAFDQSNPFAGALDQAQQFLNEQQPDQPIEEKVEQTPEQGLQPKPDVASSQVQPVDLKDEDPVKIVIDGQEKVVTYKEAKQYISGGMKFTQNQQRLAAERKQLEAYTQQIQQAFEQNQQLQQERQRIAEFLQNPQAVYKYLVDNYAQQIQQRQSSNDELATLSEAEQLAERKLRPVLQRLEQLSQTLDERENRIRADVNDYHETAKYSEVIDQHLGGIFKDQPILSAIDGMEDMIRWQVSRMQPENLEQALEYFSQVSQNYVEKIKSQFQESAKQQIVNKQKLENHTMVPAQGSKVVSIEAADYKDNRGRVDHKKVAALADRYLQQFEQ